MLRLVVLLALLLATPALAGDREIWLRGDGDQVYIQEEGKTVLDRDGRKGFTRVTRTKWPVVSEEARRIQSLRSWDPPRSSTGVILYSSYPSYGYSDYDYGRTRYRYARPYRRVYRRHHRTYHGRPGPRYGNRPGHGHRPRPHVGHNRGGRYRSYGGDAVRRGVSREIVGARRGYSREMRGGRGGGRGGRGYRGGRHR